MHFLAHRSRLALIAAACAGATLTGPTGSAFAGAHNPASTPAPAARPAASGQLPPGGFASWHDLYVEQARLDRAAARIIDAGRKAADNYTSLVADPTTRKVVVYVKGGRPVPALARLIKDLRSTVPVTVASAPYSKRQIDHAVQQAVQLVVRHKATAISRIAPDPAGTGLNVTTSVPVTTAAKMLASIPVAVHYTTGTVSIDATPGGDSRPPLKELPKGQRWSYFNGSGGSPWFTGLGLCSTAMPVVNYITGRTGLLTAKHCPSPKGYAQDVVTGSVFGQVTPVPASTGADGVYRNDDLAFIDAPSTQPAVWNNEVNSANPQHPVTSESDDIIWGRAFSATGNFIETDGAFTGQNGQDNSIEIFNTGEYVNNGGVMQGPYVRAETLTVSPAMGVGDSGGLVEMQDPTGPYGTPHYLPLGVIAAGDASQPAACWGFIPFRSKPCFQRFWYTDMGDAEQQLPIYSLLAHP